MLITKYLRDQSDVFKFLNLSNQHFEKPPKESSCVINDKKKEKEEEEALQ